MEKDLSNLSLLLADDLLCSYRRESFTYALTYNFNYFTYLRLFPYFNVFISNKGVSIFLRLTDVEVLCKKSVFLEISQNSQENTCWTLFKKRLWHRCFPVNFTKFLRAFCKQNTFGRLLLDYVFLIPDVQYVIILFLMYFPLKLPQRN